MSVIASIIKKVDQIGLFQTKNPKTFIPTKKAFPVIQYVDETLKRGSPTKAWKAIYDELSPAEKKYYDDKDSKRAVDKPKPIEIEYDWRTDHGYLDFWLYKNVID